MKANTRMGLLLGTAGVMAVMGQKADAFVGISARLAASWVDASVARGDGLLKNPGSFIVVHRDSTAPVATDAAEDQHVRISLPAWSEQTGARADAVEQTGGFIAVPDNARAGDPAYIAMEEEEDGEWYYVDDGGGTVFGPYGMAFADGVDLGYSTLVKHGSAGRHHHRMHGDGRRSDVPEFGANDLHRSAELQFAEAAQPRLAEQEAGFRRAQMAFHRATLTPGVPRQSDGLRHERAPSSSRPRGR